MEKEGAPKVWIRWLAPEEIERAADIAVAAWDPIYAGYREQLGGELFDAFYSDWKEQKRRNTVSEIQGGNCLAADAEGVVIGFAVYTAEGRIGEIKGNAVAPEWRGRGIGTMLQKRVLDEMKRIGCRFAIVQTGLDEAHEPARRIYQKNGFESSLASVKYFQKL